MTILEKIKGIVEAANCEYKVFYEDPRMMNVKADELGISESFCFIDEFTTGSYSKEAYFNYKKNKIQIYFCKFTEFQNNAIQRECKRNDIESEVIIPFINAYNTSGIFDVVNIWNVSYPFTDFDANEVSVMLEFECKMRIC